MPIKTQKTEENHAVSQERHIISSSTKSLLCAAAHNAEEHFVSFHLNAKNEIVGFQIVSRGTVSASLVHPREVFKAALLANSYALIVAHNHPAGSLTPSPEDIETTEMLIKAGDLLNVKVIDHIIVSSNGIQSLRELRPALWI